MATPKKRIYKPKCSCQLPLRDDGTCPGGCTPLKRPHATARSLEAKLAERERESNKQIGLGLANVQAAEVKLFGRRPRCSNTVFPERARARS